jgi:bacterioferritin (cytochrome b1)
MESEFLDAIEGLRATAASPSAYEVVEALDRHGREEGELLERYRRFVDQSESPAVRYLVRLILEDEERHHRLLEDLANTIAWGGVKEAPEQVVPHFPTKYRIDAALRSETQALLGHELRDRTQLRKLRRRLRSHGDVTMWELLIDIMRLDTDKHIRILRLILSNESSPGRLDRVFRRLHRRRA